MKSRGTKSGSHVIFALVFVCILIGTFLTSDYKFTDAYAKKALTKENLKPYIGVDVRGFHTSIQSTRYPIAFPSDFYEKSFALISKLV